MLNVFTKFLNFIRVTVIKLTVDLLSCSTNSSKRARALNKAKIAAFHAG